jgi:hypothetical protein
MRTETTDPPVTDDGMIEGMTTPEPKAKIAITLRPDLLGQVRARVDGGSASSVSAFIERAVEEQLRAEVEFDEMLAEMLDATGGPVTEDEAHRFARELGVEP